MTQEHAARIIEAIGEPALKKELGWTDRAIRHAKSTGTFSGLWYRPLKELCDKHGVFCPTDAFTWKTSAKKYGSTLTNNQGAES
jgi:hypothetical protein